ncbi:rhamnan synthesis F family protein [Methylorubrum thiocyanatum]|uniref:Rhamnosyltransferase n=1 Tax=Methylorubrum thiocyanatum TaxID=47958 RepID=A0AA40S8F2_9HYPH|nr:rhamnan synthesis F family protein [Methylorubrum thiocyanatum]MBA8916222.1 rhamnosyltransferase [Methylorubrum thiocyanatum]GJE83911.1 hypothetical protein CJNNKLLH_5291 [Methylorubrum thiocyanatum]
MRALIFAHFDPHDVVDPHVLYSLRCYRPYFDTIYFVSTSWLCEKYIKLVRSLVDVVICRENIGYDFASWRVGFEGLRLHEYGEVVFANDSCYGPCKDPASLFDSLSSSKSDLWGVAVNHQYRPHVQSFFMVFRRALIESGFASYFWSNVNPPPDKLNIILDYEVGLSSAVENAGFKIGGLINFVTPDLEVRNRVAEDNIPHFAGVEWEKVRQYILTENYPNPLQLYWKESMRCGCPLIKVELLRDNPLGANVKSVLEAIQDSRWYDINLIGCHLDRIAPSTWRSLFESKEVGCSK